MELKIFAQIQMAQLNLKTSTWRKTKKIKIEIIDGAIKKITIVLHYPSSQKQNHKRDCKKQNKEREVNKKLKK